VWSSSLIWTERTFPVLDPDTFVHADSRRAIHNFVKMLHTLITPWLKVG
jgi:hypothetical protein